MMAEMGDQALAAELAAVQQLVETAVRSHVPLLADASRLVAVAGGQRLRPRVLLHAYYAARGSKFDAPLRLAAAIELVHAASLIHDDLNDNATHRRGHATVNARWGSSLALLAGDLVFVRLLDLVANESPEAIRLLATACRDLVEGEALHLLAAWNPALTEAHYLEIVRLKTAALFAAAAELGGMAAQAPAAWQDALRAYGLHLGIAYQIHDDARDIGLRNGEDDLAQGIISLPAIHALRLHPELAPSVRARDPEPLRRAIAQEHSVAYALSRGRRQAARALHALGSLPASPARLALAHLAMAVANDQPQHATVDQSSAGGTPTRCAV